MVLAAMSFLMWTYAAAAGTYLSQGERSECGSIPGEGVMLSVGL